MWVLPLESRADDADATVVGGKAVGLNRLMRAGFRVPRGYVITTSAFKRTLAGSLMGLSTPEEMAEAVLECDIPVEIARAVEDANGALFGDRPVAVRSSGTGEDAAERSFAGQLESVLNVVGTDAVLDAVKRVWASFFGRSNLIYRSRVSLDSPPSYTAVVVQEMLDPRVAGVMFTADPVDHNADRFVISSASGLGETVVVGQDSETIYLSRQTGQVLQHVPPSSGRKVLEKGDIDALFAAARRIVGLFDSPQDLEWAFDAEGLAFLQCRPITTGGPAAPTPTVWSNVNVGEALPGVATPMTWSIIRGFSRLGFEKAFGALGLEVPQEYELVASFRGRIYLNLTEFASVVSSIPFLPMSDFLAIGGGSGTEELDRYGYPKRSRLSFLARLPLTVSRMAVSQVTMPFRARRWSERLQRRRDAFFRRDFAHLSRGELVRVLSDIDQLFDKTGVVMLACGSNFISSYMITSRLLKRWGGDEAAAKEHYLFSGLHGLVSAEPGLQLLDMARFVRDRPSLVQLFAQTKSDALMARLGDNVAGRELRAKLDEFLVNFGSRAAREAELSTPRWRETPDFLLDVIRSHLESPYLPSSSSVQKERARQRRDTTQLIRRHFRPGLGLVFRGILRFTQENSRVREELRGCVTDTLSMYRHFFLEVGRRLVLENALASPADVFFLTRPEIDGYLASSEGVSEFALTVGSRRAEYTTFSDLPDPPGTFVLHGSDQVPDAANSLPSDTPFLSGLSASPGRITGHARVIRDLNANAELHPGEILVAPFTDVGWTPLFLLAAGVVTELGGPLSHSAVVAREYGIPAVVNVKEATRLIETGDLITIDGDTGRVFLARSLVAG